MSPTNALRFWVCYLRLPGSEQLCPGSRFRTADQSLGPSQRHCATSTRLLAATLRGYRVGSVNSPIMALRLATERGFFHLLGPVCLSPTERNHADRFQREKATG